MVKKLILVILICTLCLTACQPTPPEEVVISKRDAHIVPTHEPKPEATVEPVNFPEHYEASQSFYDGRLMINIDADVIYVKDKPYDVYAVEETDYDPNVVQSIITYFCGDKPVYSTHRPKTKADLEAEIIETKRVMNSDDCMETEEDMLAIIEEIKERIPSAPETAEMTPVNLAEEQVSGELDLGEDYPAELSLYHSSKRFEFNTGRGYYEHFAVARDGYQDTLDSEVVYTDDWMHNTYDGVTVEQAIQIADDFLSQVGIIGFSHKKTAIGYGMDETCWHIVEDKLCHFLYYTRDVEDIPITYERSAVGAHFAPSWTKETIRFAVDESGIFDFQWRGCSEITEKLHQHVVLKDFDTVIENFFCGEKVRYAFFEEDENLIDFTIDIYEVRLGYMEMPIKDEDGYMLTPVWDFFGTMRGRDYDDDEIVVGENDWGKGSFASFTINAINGSVIDRSKGY